MKKDSTKTPRRETARRRLEVRREVLRNLNADALSLIKGGVRGSCEMSDPQCTFTVAP